jgi:hypothetical protein
MTSFLSRTFGKLQDASTRLLYGVEKTTGKMSFNSTVDKDMDGKEVIMSDYAGSVLLVVNVASK